MFWDGWQAIFQIIITAIITYIAIVALLRVSGKRTLAKMNMFDFVITIALGSVFATSITSDSVSVSEGIAAVVTLIALQFVVTRLSLALPWFKRLVKGEPTLLYFDQGFLTEAMKRERVTKEEIFQAMRKDGLLSLNQVFAVVLETDGSFTAIPAENEPNQSLKTSSLQNLPLNTIDPKWNE